MPEKTDLQELDLPEDLEIRHVLEKLNYAPNQIHFCDAFHAGNPVKIYLKLYAKEKTHSANEGPIMEALSEWELGSRGSTGGGPVTRLIWRLQQSMVRRRNRLGSGGDRLERVRHCLGRCGASGFQYPADVVRSGELAGWISQVFLLR